MIGFLKGLILHSQEDSLLLEVNGVGYEVHVTPKTLNALPVKSPASLYIYTAVREDNISLYGFLSEQEKKLFLKLISVSGIGPKVAMNILAGISVEDFILALHRQDLLKLTAVPGIGKKTAERMLVELKDKLLSLGESSPLKLSTPKKFPFAEDLLSALSHLGYNRFEIEKAFGHLAEELPLDFEQALKRLLKILSK